MEYRYVTKLFDTSDEDFEDQVDDWLNEMTMQSDNIEIVGYIITLTNKLCVTVEVGLDENQLP